MMQVLQSVKIGVFPLFYFSIDRVYDCYNRLQYLVSKGAILRKGYADLFLNDFDPHLTSCESGNA